MLITKKYPSYISKHPSLEYWDIKCLKYLLSLGAKGDIFISNSPRNYGKTYSVVELVKEVLLNGGSIAYGRYNKPELGSSMGDLLNKIDNLVPVKVEGSQLKFYEYTPTGGRIAFFYWSIAQNVKGTDWPFEYIICDEFIPERYTNKSRYDTEFKDWTSVYKTLARSYNPSVIMLANNIQWINPFYLSWGITPIDKGDIVRFVQYFSINVDGEKYRTSRTVIVENVQATKPIILRNLKQQAISFNSDKEMQNYFDNATRKEYCQIAKCPDANAPLSNIQIMSEGYYMRARGYNGLMYWMKVKQDANLTTITSEPEYIDVRTKTIKNKSVNEGLEDVFNSGLCVFDSTDTLMAFMRFLRHNRGYLMLS